MPAGRQGPIENDIPVLLIDVTLLCFIINIYINTLTGQYN
jgi:hypothetical protein